jgi:hypothetical protein
MPPYFNNPSNSERKDANAPSSVSVLKRLINPFNCPLGRPAAGTAAGVRAFSVEGTFPDLVQ